MHDSSLFWSLTLKCLLIVLLVVFGAYMLWRLLANVAKFLCWIYLRFNGFAGTGVIVATSGTGSTDKSYPVLRLRITVRLADGSTAERTYRKMCDIGNLPRAGDTINLLQSKSNPGFFVIA